MKKLKPPGSGKKKLEGKGTKPNTVTLLEEQWEFLKKLSSSGNNASEGVRILCNRAMHHVALRSQLIVTLQGAIASIEKGDLEKVRELLPVLENFLNYLNLEGRQ